MGGCCGAFRSRATSLWARRSSCPTTRSSRRTGGRIVVTQEDKFVISVIDLATHRIVLPLRPPRRAGLRTGLRAQPRRRDANALGRHRRWRHQELPGSRDRARRPTRSLRQLGEHRQLRTPTAAASYGSPNGAFPMADGDYGGHRDQRRLARRGQAPTVGPCSPPIPLASPTRRTPTRSARACSSSADYTKPRSNRDVHQPTASCTGATHRRAPQALDEPSLALPLPNGDVLANDDNNNRVIVVDPRTQPDRLAVRSHPRAGRRRRVSQRPRWSRSRAAVLAGGALRPHVASPITRSLVIELPSAATLGGEHAASGARMRRWSVRGRGRDPWRPHSLGVSTKIRAGGTGSKENTDQDRPR